MTISRLRTPLLIVVGFALAFGAALWVLAANGGTGPAIGATDDAAASEEDQGAHGKEGCAERKEQMLDKMVEAGKLTEVQKATVLGLMEQVKDGEITHQELKAALKEEDIDLPHPKFRGPKGGARHMDSAEMLDRLVEKEIITEEQKAIIVDLTVQLKNGDLTKEEFMTALEDAEIEMPKFGKHGKDGPRGHRGFGGADKATTAL